jgi:hypothetical protein
MVEPTQPFQVSYLQGDTTLELLRFIIKEKKYNQTGT